MTGSTWMPAQVEGRREDGYLAAMPARLSRPLLALAGALVATFVLAAAVAFSAPPAPADPAPAPSARRSTAATWGCRAPSAAATSPSRCAAATRGWGRRRSPSRSAAAATPRRPRAGTIMAMDGGPGYASTAAPYARSLVAALGPLLRDHDLVLFDERGTGLSDVVDCPTLQAGLVQESTAIGECANRLGPALRRLHHRRSRRRPRRGPPRPRPRQGLLLRRLLRHFLRPGLRRPLPGHAPRPRPRLRLSRGRPLLPDARCRPASTACGSPAATRPAAPATRRPPHPRRPSLPCRATLDRGPDRLSARRRHPGAALLPQPRRRRPPLPRR